MDGDEVFVVIGSVLLAGWAGGKWYVRLFLRRLTPWRVLLPSRLLVGALPLALLGALYIALRLGAAAEVRTDGGYIFLFLALGAAWLLGVGWAARWLGIHVGDDVVERNNVAAAIAVAGMFTGGMLIYGGANMGEGDTIWTTIGPALLGTLLALILWGGHQAFSGAAEAITLDRDLASGIRFAGMTVATGLVIARTVVGDYASAAGTVHDLFAQGWPALPVMALSLFVQRKLRPTKQRPAPDAVRYGLVPALACLALGVLVVRYYDPTPLMGTKQ